ncbi:hypothetical protein E4K72_02090 [Oxalobacteraceae bacterium OM1]|nr:hypothetical protein E4K72_02090 [Oxalobacteraceae bacterium OM1]
MNDHFGNSVNIKYSTVSRANYLNYTRVDDGIFNPTQINYLRQRAQVDLSWFDPKMSIDSNILYAGGFPSPRSEWLRDIYAWSKSFPTDQQIDYAQCIFTPNTSSIYDALAPMLNKMVQCNYLPEVSFQYEPFQNYENTIQELNWNSFPGDLHD